MRQLEPQGMGRRVLGALVLLVGVAWGSHEAWLLLQPLVPGLVTLAVVIGVYLVIFRRR